MEIIFPYYNHTRKRCDIIITIIPIHIASIEGHRILVNRATTFCSMSFVSSSVWYFLILMSSTHLIAGRPAVRKAKCLGIQSRDFKSKIHQMFWQSVLHQCYFNQQCPEHSLKYLSFFRVLFKLLEMSYFCQ